MGFIRDTFLLRSKQEARRHLSPRDHEYSCQRDELSPWRARIDSWLLPVKYIAKEDVRWINSERDAYITKKDAFLLKNPITNSIRMEPSDSASSMITTIAKFPDTSSSASGLQNRGKQESRLISSRLQSASVAPPTTSSKLPLLEAGGPGRNVIPRDSIAGDTMNKQRSRARSSELVERGLIGILIAVPGRTRTAPEVFARGLKRLQHQSRLASLTLRRANPLALLSALKHYETPHETPLPPRRVVLEGSKY